MNHDFFARDAKAVAKELIGCELIHKESTKLIGRIVETEAYYGSDDRASHAFSGMTDRNKPMFKKPGKAYVYISYGIHNILNVVTGLNGNPSAVLLRAVKPLKGLERMKENRRINEKKELCSGPGKLTEAFGITKDHNRIDLIDSNLWIEEREFKGKIVRDKRIGVSNGGKMELRFYEEGNSHVSRL